MALPMCIYLGWPGDHRLPRSLGMTMLHPLKPCPAWPPPRCTSGLFAGGSADGKATVVALRHLSFSWLVNGEDSTD